MNKNQFDTYMAARNAAHSQGNAQYNKKDEDEVKTVSGNSTKWYTYEGRDENGFRTHTFESDAARRYRIGDFATDHNDLFESNREFANREDKTQTYSEWRDEYKKSKAQDDKYKQSLKDAENKRNYYKVDQLSDKDRDLLDNYIDDEYMSATHPSSGAGIVYGSRAREDKERFKEQTGVDENTFNFYVEWRRRAYNAEKREASQNEINEKVADKSTAELIFSKDTAQSVLGNTIGGPMAYLGAIGERIENNAPTEKIDTNSQNYRYINQARDYRQAAGDQIEQRHGTAARFGYDIGMSILDSTASMAFGNAGLALMGTTAAANAIQDAQNRGLDRDHALAYGTLVGAVEGITEKFSLDKAFDILKSKGVRGLRSRLGQLATALVTEGSEEAAADIADALGDAIINGDKSEYKQSVREYEAQGLSEDDARKRAALDFCQQVGLDALGGAIAGGVHGGIALSGNRMFTAAEANKMFSEGNYAEYAEAIDTDENTYSNKGDLKAAQEAKKLAEELAKKQENDEKITTRDKTRLLDLINETQEGAQRAKEGSGSSILDKLARIFTRQQGDETAQNESVAPVQPEIPERYKARQTDVTPEQATRQMARARSATELSEAYQAARNSTNEITRREADKIYQINEGRLQSEGRATGEEIRQSRLTPEDAYRAGAAGEKLEGLSPAQAAAYNDGIVAREKKSADVRVTDRTISLNGENTNIETIETLGDNPTIKTESGQVLPLSEANFVDETTRRAYIDAVSTFSTAEAANDYIAGIPATTPYSLYQGVATEAYTRGRLGVSIDGLLARKYIAKEISRETLERLYEAGTKEKEATSHEDKEKKTRGQKKTGRVIDSRADKDTKHPMYRLAKDMSEKLGIDIELTENDGIINGSYNPDAGKIILNMNSDNGVYNTFFHEAMGEFAEAWNKNGMGEVQEMILDWWMQEHPEEIDKLIRKYQAAYTQAEGAKSYREAANEAVNDALSGLFSTPEGINDFVNWLENNKKNEVHYQTVLERIANFIKDLIDTLNRYIIGNPNMPAAARSTMQMSADQAAGLRARILEVMDQAIENYAEAEAIEGEGEVGEFAEKGEYAEKERLPEDIIRIIKNLTKDIKKWDRTDPHKKFIVGKIDGPIAQYTPRKGRIILDASKLSDTQKKHPEMKDGTIALLPELFANPVLIMDSKNPRFSTRIIVVGSVTAKNKPIMAVLEMQPNSAGITVEDIKVASTQARSNLQGLINSSHALWVDNKKRSSWERNTGLQLPVNLSTTSNFIIEELSKNATTKSSDERHSLSVDSEGRELTPGQQEYFKDSKIRDEEGNLIPVYHGTDADFTVFDRSKGRSTMDIQGSFFSPWELDAQGYGTKVRSFYLNIKNPASEGIAYKALNKFAGQNNAGKLAREYLESKGYDGVNNSNEEYIAFYPEQIKMTDNENPTDDPDIRHSLSGIDDDIWDSVIGGGDVSDVFADSEYVSNIDDTLRQVSKMLEAANAPMRGHTINRDRIIDIAGRIKDNYGSTISKNVLADNLAHVFDYLQHTENIDYEDMTRVLSEVAAPVIEKTASETVEEFEDFKQRVRGYRIKLNNEQKQELAAIYGSYEDARKRNFGRITFSDDGTPLDSVWSELARESYGLLDENENTADQPIALIGAIDNISKGHSELNFTRGQDTREAAVDLAIEIMEEYYKAETDALRQEAVNGALESGMAGAAAKEAIDRARADMKRQQEEFRKKTKAEYEERLKKIEAQTKQNEYYKRIADYNESTRRTEQAKREAVTGENYRLQGELSEAYKKIKALQKNSVEDYKESQDRIKTKKEITKLGNNLMNRIINPTTKKHVPTDLQKPLAEFLSGIDFISHRAAEDSKKTLEWRDKMKSLSIYLSQLEDGKVEDDIDFLSVLDPDLNSDIRNFVKDTDGYAKVSQLDAKQLKQLESILKRIQAAINNVDKSLANQQYERVSDLAVATKHELGDRKARKGTYAIIDTAREFFNIAELDPTSYFSEMGDASYSIFKALREGFDKRVWHLKDVQDYTEKIREDVGVKNFADWRKETHTFQTAEGELTLTTAQIMSLYELMKRDQAREHITRGGIKAADRIEGVLHKKVEQLLPIHITPAEYQNIVNTLTPDQIEVADKIQAYMATECAKWGNNVSKKLYGYEKFTEKNYFPISVDKNTTAANDKNTSDNASMWHLRNIGAAQDLTPHAKNAIVISDIFSVFTQHATEMATYDGMVLPLTDAMRWYNFRAVNNIFDESSEYGDINYEWNIQQEIERVLGKPGQQYFTKLIKDINGMNRSDGLGVIGKLMGNYKAAAVAANMRVVVQQPTAYARAFAEMDARDLTAALSAVPIAGKYAKKAQENCAIALWKSWGFYETYMGQSLEQIITGDSSIIEKVKDTAGIGAQKADDWTWGILWRACEIETSRLHPDLEYDSKEYLKAVAERMSYVVDRTQVVDSTLHRSDIMRRQDGLAKTFTAFMAEPTKNYNMLHRAFVSGGKKERTKAITAYLAANLLTAAFAALIDAARHDDDEHDYKELWTEAFWENAKDNINPLNMFPVVKDLYASIESIIGGGYSSSNSDMSLAGFTQTAKAAGDIYKYLNPNVDYKGRKTPYGLAKDLTRGVSQLSGVPFYNVWRDVEAAHNMLFENWAATTDTNYGGLHNAIADDNDIEGSVQKLLDKGVAASSIQSHLTKQYKDEYIALDEAERPAMKNKLLKAYAAIGKDYDKYIDKWVTDAEKEATESTTTEAAATQEAAGEINDSQSGEQHEEYASDYVSVYDAIDKGGDIAGEVQKMLSTGKKKSAIKSAITRHYKEDYLSASGATKANMKNTLIRAYTAAGYTRDEAIDTIEGW